jgi:hypothetical protein
MLAVDPFQINNGGDDVDRSNKYWELKHSGNRNYKWKNKASKRKIKGFYSEIAYYVSLDLWSCYIVVLFYFINLFPSSYFLLYLQYVWYLLAHHTALVHQQQ